MSQCTYVVDGLRCTAQGTSPQTAQDGQQWANLCAIHAQRLNATIGVDVRRMLREWIRCGGGPRAMADRMIGGKY